MTANEFETYWGFLPPPPPAGMDAGSWIDGFHFGYMQCVMEDAEE